MKQKKLNAHQVQLLEDTTAGLVDSLDHYRLMLQELIFADQPGYATSQETIKRIEDLTRVCALIQESFETKDWDSVEDYLKIDDISNSEES